MVTGLEMYDALRAATRKLPVGGEFVVNAIEAHDLGKLTVRDLLSRDYSEKIAKEVTSSLPKGNLGFLGQSMGIRFAKSHEAPRLLFA